MQVSDTGVPVDELVDTIKRSVRQANISAADQDADLRVTAVRLVLSVVATRVLGGGFSLKVPFLGMELTAGAKTTRQNTHTIDMTLAPPDQAGVHEVRGDIEETLVDAITTIRAVMSRGAYGADPWFLETGTVRLIFAVTRTGTLSLGLDSELDNQVTHTLQLSCAPTKNGVIV